MSLGQQSQVKEISNTKLLVSLNDNWRESANMEIFDVSAKERPRKIYSFEEVFGGNVDSNRINYICSDTLI